jgi:hypothetical protein
MTGFWRQCMQLGARGSAPLANDWQWAIGNPTIAAISPAVIAGLAAWFGKDYVTTEHPILGPFVVALGAYIVTWTVAFTVRTLKAAPQLYYQQKNRADDAESKIEEQLKPKIDVFLDNGGVRLAETRVSDRADAPRGPDTKWVQITVRGATELPLADCEVRLLTAERIADDGTAIAAILTEPVFCTWSNMPESENRRMTIPPRVPQSANLFMIANESTELATVTAPIKFGFRDEIKKAGKYRLRVAVSAKDCPTETRAYLFRWGGTYNEISLDPE